ncbi:MAG: enolase C-terminal domain-like protein [Sciscionella sp.]
MLPTGIAVAQPDRSHAGGISEVRRIAAMAETYDVALAPHLPARPDRTCGRPPDRVHHPTSSSRGRVVVSTTTGKGISPTTCSTLLRSTSSRDPPSPPRRPASAWISTRPRYAARRRSAIAGPVWRRSDGAFTEW